MNSKLTARQRQLYVRLLQTAQYWQLIDNATDENFWDDLNQLWDLRLIEVNQDGTMLRIDRT